MNATLTVTTAMVSQAVREYPGRTAGFYADLTSRTPQDVQASLDRLVGMAALETVPGPITGVTLYQLPICLDCSQAVAGHGHWGWYCEPCANA